MAITELSVSGYRSIRRIDLELNAVNVLVGPNGCGKSNLYRSIALLASAASGNLAREIAAEGGMPSVLWAGRRMKGPVRMRLEVTARKLSYALELGLPAPIDPMGHFLLDPRIKEETVTFVDGAKRIQLLDRGVGSAWMRSDKGERHTYPGELWHFESVLTQLREPHRFAMLSSVRDELLSWRFYHHFRTDSDSPLRRPQVGVFTPALSADGSDLAAALSTIQQIGDGASLATHVARAFGGATLQVEETAKQRFEVSLETPGIQRPFDSAELSDGTLRYLCLLAALLTPRPPSLIALNEPETSLHPDLLEPLAMLIGEAAAHSQLWITTHSEKLANAIKRQTGIAPIRLRKVDGETQIDR